MISNKDGSLHSSDYVPFKMIGCFQDTNFVCLEGIKNRKPWENAKYCIENCL